MATKRLTARHIKAEPSGEFTALVYTCQARTLRELHANIRNLTPDLDGDLIPADAFDTGTVAVISQWGHSAFDSAPPAGRGTIHVEGLRVLLKGKFFMNTQAGRDTYHMVKELGDRCEWSIGFLCDESEDLS